MSEMKSLTLNGKQYDSFVDAVARPLSSATAIVRSASGESVVLPDSSDYKMLRLSVYGKSTQDGVPSLDAPVEIVSVANPTITINKVPLSIPHSLPGILVASGGNYTDASGQQWICDEVDLVRGVYVRRVGTRVLNGANDEHWDTTSVQYYLPFPDKRSNYTDVGNALVCSHFKARTYIDNSLGFVTETHFSNGNINVLFNYDNGQGGLNNFIAWLRTNPITVQYVLATPVETPLSAEEIATYGALYTTRPSTTLSINKGASMSVEYVADTKAYIDSLVIAGGASAGIHNATVE